MLIKILTINLRFGLAQDGENNWVFRKNSFRELFQKYNWNFICAQEVNDFQADFLSGILKDKDFIGLRKPAPNYWQSNVIFYDKSFCLENFSHIYLSETPESPSKFSESKWPRQCTFGTFKTPAGEIIIVNTHFDFRESVQVKSAELILKRLGSMKNLPTIITGDFNAKPTGKCHEIFTKKTHDTDKPFRDVFENQESPATHHKFTGQPDESTGRIDWILYRGCLKLREKKIMQEKFDNRYPSDHFPVFADFDLNTK